jgi:glycosyltransferase involved in cell wall biosynthesis
MNPLITIIIPCYKVEKYLPACINSVLKQTYKDLEIYLVDDGSPDNCGLICDEYAKIDDRIRVIHKSNGGLSDARNAAINVAKGEFITFIDSDDTVSECHIEELYRLVKKYNCSLSVCQWQTYCEGERLVVKQKKLKEICYNTPQEAVTAMFYQEEFDNAACVKLYHRSLFDDIKFPKGLLFEDDYTVYQLFFKSDKIAYSNKITYYYLLRSDSIEGASFSKKKMDSALEVFRSMEDDHFHLISQVLPAYQSRYLSFCMHLLLKAPKGYDRIGVLWDRIKKYRKPVILDGRARPKARIAAILSYFGVDVLKFAFKLVDKRK